MTPPKELEIVRTIENADKTRRLVVSIVEHGARWKCLRLTSFRRAGFEWRQIAFVDVPPQFIDELMLGFDAAFEALTTRGAA